MVVVSVDRECNEDTNLHLVTVLESKLFLIYWLSSECTLTGHLHASQLALVHLVGSEGPRVQRLLLPHRLVVYSLLLSFVLVGIASESVRHLLQNLERPRLDGRPSEWVHSGAGW